MHNSQKVHLSLAFSRFQIWKQLVSKIILTYLCVMLWMRGSESWTFGPPVGLGKWYSPTGIIALGWALRGKSLFLLHVQGWRCKNLSSLLLLPCLLPCCLPWWDPTPLEGNFFFSKLLLIMAHYHSNRKSNEYIL